MSNQYVVNALWNAALDAVNHHDLEALKGVISAIELQCNDSAEVSAEKNNEVNPWESKRSMNYLDIVAKLDEADAFGRFHYHVSSLEFRPINLVDWIASQADIKWIAETKNFKSQLNNVLHYAVIGSQQLRDHRYLKYLKKGDRHGLYFFDPTVLLGAIAN